MTPWQTYMTRDRTPCDNQRSTQRRDRDADGHDQLIRLQHGVEDAVGRIRDLVGIEGVRCSPHTFRHTFSTMYLEQGGPIEWLSRELGHSKVNVTEQYIKSLPLSVARQDHEEYSPVRRLKLSSKRRPAS